MKLWWLGPVAMVPLALAVACSDDDNPGGTGTTRDSGSDAQTYTPPEPPRPLQCATAAMFDPCDAGLDPSVFGATEADGGAIANVDAGGYADAGYVPAACVTTGAVRIGCEDGGGAAYFDLAAGDAGTSHVIAFGPHASRFDVGPDATMSPLTLFDSRNDDLRIVSSGAGVAVIEARTGTKDVRVQRDGQTTHDFAELEGTAGDQPIAGAGMADDGTISALFHASGKNFWRLPIHDPKDTTYQPNLASANATALHVAPDGTFVMAAQFPDKLDLFYPGSTGASSQIDTPGLTSLFAVGLGSKGTLAAGYDSYGAMFVFVAHDRDATHVTRIRLEREPQCGLHETGCGQTCTETRRLPLVGGGSFVRLANGKDYFVYGEASVTSERHYSTDYDVVCGLFGGCACLSKAEVKSVGDVDAVVMEVTTDPDQLVERARAHLVLTDPQHTLLNAKPGSGLRATARDDQIHVLLQGSGNEMARVVIDLGTH